MREKHDQHGPERRRQGIEARERRLRVDQPDAGQDHREAQAGGDAGEARRDMPRRRRVAALEQVEGGQRAEPEFPGPGRQQKEARHRPLAPADLGQREAGERGGRDPEQRAARAEAPQQQQAEREQHVILLLHRQAPGMEQRVFLPRPRKIVGVPPEIKIGGEEYHRNHRPAEAGEFVRQHEPEGEGYCDQHDEIERGQYAPRPPLVEPRQREPALRDFAEQDRGDQIAAQHEEHIDADEPAGEGFEPGVKQHHRDHGHRAKPIDLTAILHGTMHYDGPPRTRDVAKSPCADHRRWRRQWRERPRPGVWQDRGGLPSGFRRHGGFPPAPAPGKRRGLPERRGLARRARA